MPVPAFTGLGPEPSFQDIVNKVNTLVGELRNLMLSLDDVNFNSITAKVINVDQLSAISANLGEITAGIIRGIEIYGSYIATAQGTYPRAEMNVSGNFFAAMNSALDKLTIYSNDGSGSPGISFDDASSSATINYKTNGLQLVSLKDIALAAVADIILSSSGGNIKVSSWSKFVNNGTGVSLQSALDSKANGSGISGTVYVATTPGGSPTTPISFSNGVRTS